MVNGAHLLLYSSDAEADRTFFRDVLGMPNADVGDGWLIFALPPAEMAVHPIKGAKLEIQHGGDDLASFALYLMCDDVNGVISTLTQKSVPCAPVTAAPWGLRTAITLPSGAKVGLYEPRHPKPPRS